MTDTCMGDSRGNVISLQDAEGTKPSRLTMSSSVVRKNIEGSRPEAFGQRDDMRVIFRRGQAVHENDNGPRFTVQRPGAGRELDTVAREQPRAVDGRFGHIGPPGHQPTSPELASPSTTLGVIRPPGHRRSIQFSYAPQGSVRPTKPRLRGEALNQRSTTASRRPRPPTPRRLSGPGVGGVRTPP